MTKRHAVAGEVVHFVGGDTASIFREIADYFEEQGDNATFIGAWDTCCGEPWELTIQVVVTHEASGPDNQYMTHTRTTVPAADLIATIGPDSPHPRNGSPEAGA